MADSNVRGRFVWHELWTPNRSGAEEFYAQTVGWRMQPWQHDESYALFVGPQGPVGAAVENRSATPQWLPVIATADVDATVAAATRLGARIHTEPASLPDAGRYAVLIDPQGASFGVHASGDAPTSESGPAGAGEFSWHELATSVAPEEAFAFYAELFGWDEQSRYDMGPMGTYLIFGRAGTQLGGIFDKGAAGRPGAAYWLGYVNVEDLDAATERAKVGRASVLAGPMDVPGGDRIAQLMDPHGAFFALHVRAAAVGATPEPERAARPRPSKAPARRKKKTAAARPRRPAKRAAATKPAAKKARKKAKAAGPRRAAKKKPKGKAKRPAARPKPRTKTAAKKRRRR
jgi:predicted enzyme related to lactoylglutathione lyase